ncbi:hypothetical protein [Bacillus sp. Marseille-P3661]|uniref:hypothetical protein n=1 Tax=Bacillus sp. Marseille-P3661 TaxID=1936234 RepID=UPI000C815995|nr:hypothetical protein [Bacillus sp. Marseille-P3661]
MKMTKQERQEMKWKLMKTIMESDNYSDVPLEILALGTERIYRYREQKIEQYIDGIEVRRINQRKATMTDEKFELDIPAFLRNRNRDRNKGRRKKTTSFSFLKYLFKIKN